jgi:hypothetical protein
MDLDQLVEQITDMVMARLSADAGEESAPLKEVPVSRDRDRSERHVRGIIVFTESRPQLEEFSGHIRALSSMPISWTLIVSRDMQTAASVRELQPLKAQIVETLQPSWHDIIVASDFLVVPVLTVTLCSKIAHLIADDVPSQVIMAALLERKPVIVGAEEIAFFNRFSAQLPKPLVAMLNGTLEIVRSMGVKEVPLMGIESEIKRLIGQSGSPARGRNVITKADIEAALGEGKRGLEFLRGTIITPLAREYAEMMNMTIQIR